MNKKYRNYFQINEGYISAVNEEVIRTMPDVWKSYYPHDSFIRLLNQAKSVLTSGQKMSIWVEGPYGTGKSHAVLTLKKLLDCSNEELKEYFDRYASVLSKDLYNEFYSIKNQPKKVLAVHRMGSSEIKNDRILMESIQESIISALQENGYDYLGQLGIKQAMINWLSDEVNKNYFNSIIRSPEYKARFSGASADTILANLKNYTSEMALQSLIEKISEVGDAKGIKPFVLKKEDLRTWIIDVIGKNNLKAIFFIWDEFSDYFDLNKGNLSGFQFMAEMSESHPFYFAIVTHKSEIFFENASDDVRKKINGRFIAPHCTIDLPDNMAFLLMAHAMQKVGDAAVVREWDHTIEVLYDLTHDSRKEVMKAAKIGERELKGVLPIHPYAALVLKHISSAFDSNQRSMFDFIKNNRGEEIKSFQWFIDNYGPDDDDALLTVDMLWDFFYEKGRDQLAPQIRSILDVYGRTEAHDLTAQQKRVLKTILLLQAMNEKVGDAVLLFVPNAKNLGLAFEGTNISYGNAVALAQSLVKAQIIFERTMGGGATKYSALISNGNQEEIEKEKERLKKEIKTDKLVEEGEFSNDFRVPKYLEIRFPNVRYVTYENIKTTVAQLKSDSANHPTRLYAVYAFARNAEESVKIRAEIAKTFEDNFERIVFIDYSEANLSNDLFDHYIENLANCNYQRGKDNGQSASYYKNAKEALKRWKLQIKTSTPRLFTDANRSGVLCNSESEVISILKDFDMDHFELSLETHVNVIDNMYASNALRQGAECGLTGEIKGTFKSPNENTKLEKQFAGVWNVEKYWITRPNELLSKVKIAVENKIAQKLSSETRVSISDIYNVLIDPPFGFMPCNLSAFVLGFVLKEYADHSYNWTDDVTTDLMSVEKMKEMIDEIIKQQQTPNPKYRTKYIVAMSPEQKAFNKGTSFVFGIDEKLCSSIENTRSFVRTKMTTFGFPIWTLKLVDFPAKTSKDILDELIDLYVELANNVSQRTETDIALQIGRLYSRNEYLLEDFKNILTRENCILGMQKYLGTYRGGQLISLAQQIGDTGSFINEIGKKFSESTNWVWNKGTINEKIDETITEYEIVSESNRLIVRTSFYADCLSEWRKKTQTFKVSYSAVRLEVGELQGLLEFLYQISRDGSVYDADKEKFLAELKERGAGFGEFCENQLALLKKIGSFYLNDLSDDDISEIASRYLANVFACENSEFQAKLDAGVKAYKANMSKYKLAALWREKTGTESPEAWSNEYTMPILCMISPTEQENARAIFEIINRQISDKAKIDDAIEYLTHFRGYDELKDKETREACFRRAVLRNFTTLFDNAEEIGDEIKNKFPMISPYNWLGNAAIEDYVSKAAYRKYTNGGSAKVNAVIDSMGADELRKYLKELVTENMTVGVEILNNKK